MRKAYSAGLAQKWLKSFKEVLETPKWKYKDKFIHDKVVYTHGEGGSNLQNLLLNTRKSIVIGHFHTKAEIVFNASEKDLIWGMNVGCGIDIKKYAFMYALHNVKRPIIACGLVLNSGRIPLLLPMKL